MSFEEEIMSKNKYSSIFSPQMEAIVFIHNTRSFEIGEYHTDSPVTRLDRSRASENI